MSDAGSGLDKSLTLVEALIDFTRCDDPEDWGRFCQLSQAFQGRTGITPAQAAQKRLVDPFEEYGPALSAGYVELMSRLEGRLPPTPDPRALMHRELLALKMKFLDRFRSARASCRLPDTAINRHGQVIDVHPAMWSTPEFKCDLGANEIEPWPGLRLRGVCLSSGDTQAANVDRSKQAQSSDPRSVAINRALDDGADPGNTISWKDFTAHLREECGASKSQRGFSVKQIERLVKEEQRKRRNRRQDI